MAVFDLFSKRMKRELGETPDVYAYDDIPAPLRVQIVHVWQDSIGKTRNDTSGSVSDLYFQLACVLRREYGVFCLTNDNYHPNNPTNAEAELSNFFLKSTDVYKVLDVIELTCRAIDKLTRGYSYRYQDNADQLATEALEEINTRLREHAIGYQYANDILIRLDSELLHSEAVLPALHMLSKKEYAGPQEEFLKAHEHYRHGRKSEAIVECCKAFESMMKSICDKKNWTYDKNASAKQLIDVCYKQNLIPSYWQNHFSALRTLLETAIPTPRNKNAGHGAGSVPASIPDELVPYVLHMTAATMLFLGEAESRLP